MQGRSAPGRLLEPAMLARLGSLELVAKTVVDGVMTGLHRSPHFGFSQEFAEYRAYNEGDDLRFVDWNVYARTDRAYVKRFRGETSTCVTLLVDASASMGFGEPHTKLDTSRWLAAAFAWMARRQRDALAIATFDEALRDWQPPSARPDSLPRALGLLENLQAGAGTELGATLKKLRNTITRRGLVVLISDLYADPDEIIAALQPFAHAGQDLAVFRVLAPEEIEPSVGRVTALQDMERNDKVIVDPTFLEEGYRARFQAHDDALQRACRRVGADRVLVRTDEPLDLAVQAYLRFRESRGR